MYYIMIGAIIFVIGICLIIAGFIINDDTAIVLITWGLASVFAGALIIVITLMDKGVNGNKTINENSTEIQEVTSKSISKESITTVEYKDLEGNTKKTFISGVKTSEEYIPYSYIETKTYRIGFLYKDVNTLCLKK